MAAGVVSRDRRGAPSDRSLLDTMMLGPAARVLGAGEDMGDYRRALQELAGRIQGGPLFASRRTTT